MQGGGPDPGGDSRLPAGGVDVTMIRLVNGSGLHEGRVEVYHDRRWGTVCDDGWDKKDGDVVCRMLGFRGAEEVYRTAHFGQGKPLDSDPATPRRAANIQACLLAPRPRSWS